MFNILRKRHKKINTILEFEEQQLLFKKYPESKKMFQTIQSIKNRNPKIRKLFNRQPVELYKHDTRDLIQIIILQDELLIREREIFKRIGARKSIAYLKQIEELRDERRKSNEDNPRTNYED